MNKTNILQINVTSVFGGGPEQMYNLIKGLNKALYNVVVACPNDGPYFRKLQVLGIRVFDLPIRKLSLIVIPKLTEIVKNNDISLIHSHGKGAGFYGRILGALMKKPVIHTYHGLHYKKYSLGAQWLLCLLERILSLYTSKVINVSHGERNRGIRLRLYNHRKSKIVYNCIDIGKFDDVMLRSAQEVREEFGLNSECTVIMTVGRFDLPKGYEYLIRAIPGVIRECQMVKFILIGDGALKHNMEMLSHKLNVSDCTIFTGFRDDVPELLKICDIFVLPSLGEGLPLSALEAMVCSKPVIATDVMGNNEVVKDDETGILVPSQNPGALTNAILTLVKDKELAKCMGRRGRERVIKLFSLEKMDISLMWNFK